MRPQPHAQQQVAGRPAARAVAALAGQTDRLTVAHPGRDPDDPDPAAHAISDVNPVSATNPNPPACSPQTGDGSHNGMPCPADKLVVTPSAPIRGAGRSR